VKSHQSRKALQVNDLQGFLFFVALVFEMRPAKNALRASA